MTDQKHYPMPELREQDRKDILSKCEAAVNNPENYQVWFVAMAKMTLAALTAPKPEPVGYIDPKSLKEYRGVRAGGSWSGSPRAGEYNQTLPIYTAPPVPALKPVDYFSLLVSSARERADKAMRKFPQPNYVLNKLAEENGEVIKAVIHYTEGRESWDNVEGEIIDNLAMLIRLVTEGDQVIGFTPPKEAQDAE